MPNNIGARLFLHESILAATVSATSVMQLSDRLCIDRRKRQAKMPHRSKEKLKAVLLENIKKKMAIRHTALASSKSNSFCKGKQMVLSA